MISHRWFRLPACWGCALLLLGGVAEVDVNAQTFSTVIEIPPDPDLGDGESIGSDTKVELGAGGSIGNQFSAGASDGTSTNIEVEVSGGTVGNQFNAFGGSTVNIEGGTIGDFMTSFAGSTVNLQGGTVGDLFSAHSGSVVNHLFGDGHVFGLDAESVDPNVYLHLITRGDGEPIPEFQ